MLLAEIDLGDVLWTLLVLFIMIQVLVIAGAVILDLFRSKDLSGVQKAVWVVALLLLPIISLVVYLLQRGDTMGERNLARDAVSLPPPPPIPPMPAAASELKTAKELLDAGTISQEEFDRLKDRLLS